MAMQPRIRKQTTVEYSSNNVVSKQMGRGMVYRQLMIRLTGAPTLTNVNNTRAKTKNGDEWAVVKKIRIVANGTDVIKDISGNALWWLNRFLYKIPPRITPAIGDAATANPPFDSVLILPFWMFDTVNPMDTALDSSQLSSLEIQVQWGAFTDINGDATAWTTEPTLDVWSTEVILPVGANRLFSNWRLFAIEQAITATNPQFQVQLPVGFMYRGFMIQTTDAGVDEGDIMTNLKLVSGTTVYADIAAGANVLQQFGTLQKGVYSPYDEGGNVYDDLRRSDEAKPAGWYWMDMVQDGLLTEAVDSLGFSELTLELAVTVGAGTTKVTVWPLQIIPVRGGNPRA